jgi:antitoxin (DNA-binding transcriptional repressor) of toxin-antitoxin stability system
MIIILYTGRIALMKTITATEAVRKFSEILNSIKYAGTDYTIVRGGKPIATIRPAENPAKELTLGDLKAVVKALPALGDEAERFKKDVKEAHKHQPHMPEKDKWA